MANEASAPPQVKFQLNGQQMLALSVIELVQAQMTVACNAIVERSGQKDAADLVHAAIVQVEGAKLVWLENTQRAVRLISELQARPVIEGLQVR